MPAQIPGAEDIAQRYKLELIFEQDFLDDGDDEKLPYFLRGFFSLGSLKMNVEYSDYSVAQSVDATVSGWIHQLPRKNRSKVHGFVKTIEPLVMNFGGAVAACLALASGSWLLTQGTWSAPDAVSLVLFCLALATLAAPIVHSLCSRIYAAFRRTVPCPTLLLTQGDRDRVAKAEQAAARAKVMLSILFLGCILSFCVSFSAAWVFQALMVDGR